MTDIAFALQGDFVPVGYARALLQAIVTTLPWFAMEPLAGVVPLRGTQQDGGIWLPRRTKLVLRLPVSRIGEAHALSGQRLALGKASLLIEAGEIRPHKGHPTLHARLVTSALDETEFMAFVEAELSHMGITGQCLCGKHRTLRDGDRTLRGYSLVVHHLKPDQSLLLQGMGLGQNRTLGCGIFVPFKAIPNLA
jgi:CRISPR-associated protein Cas6